MNLVGIAKSLSVNTKSKSLQKIYGDYMTNNLVRTFIKKIPALDFVKIVFLTKAINDGKDPNKELQTINSFLFVFSSVYFSEDEIEKGCDECGYDGTITCDECGGSGDNNCDECDGSGIDPDSEDEESCNSCDGSGRETCNNCDGAGSDECQYCDGTGSIQFNDLTKYVISEYVSYNTSVFDYVYKHRDSNEEIDESYILDSPNTFRIFIDEKEPETISDSDFDIDQRFRGSTYINKVDDLEDVDLSHFSSSIESSNGELQVLRYRFLN